MMMNHRLLDDTEDDNDSVKTEDYVTKFSEMAMEEARRTPIGKLRTFKSNTTPGTDRSFIGTRIPNSTNIRGSRSRETEHLDSVRTEDFEKRFRIYSRGGTPLSVLRRSADTPTTDKRQHDSQGAGNISSVRPDRRDILSKFFEKTCSGNNDFVTNLSRGKSKSPERTRQSVAFKPAGQPTSGRCAYPMTAEPKYFNEDELSAEIRKRTEEIKREIQNERMRSHTVEGNLRREALEKNRAVTPREKFDQKVKDFDRLSLSARMAKSERDNLASELDELQETLRKNLAEVRLNEKMVNDSRAKADDIKMELLLAETKRDSTKEDLDRLTTELNKRRKQLKDLEEKMRERLDEITELESTGLSREEIEAVVAERNELYEILKLSEDNENHRYELEKKLSAVKEDLTLEQKRSREAVVALEEELEASFGKIADIRREKENLSDQLYSTEQKSKQLEKKLSALQNDFSDLKAENEAIKKDYALEIKKIEETHSESLSKHQNEKEAQLKQHLQQLQETNERLRNELQELRKSNESNLEEKEKLENKLIKKEKKTKDQKSDFESKIAKMEEAKEKEIELLKRELTKHQSNELTEVRLKYEQERDETLTTLKETYQKHMAEIKSILEQKDEEITYLKSHIRLQEDNFSHVAKEMEAQFHEKLKESLNKEKSKLESQQNEHLQQEIEKLKKENRDTVTKLEDEIEEEKKISKTMEKENNVLREESEASKEKYEKMLFDKENELKGLQESSKLEIERIRKDFDKDVSETVEALRSELEKENMELKTSLSGMESRVTKLTQSLQSLSTMIQDELHKECVKIAEIIRIEPPKLKKIKESSTMESAPTNVSDCLASLKYCTEELDTFVTELIKESEQRIQKMKESEKTKSKEMEEFKATVEEKSIEEMSKFKEKMFKEHLEEVQKARSDPKLQDLLREKEQEIRDLNASMKKWKEQTAEMLAIKLQNEFRAEFEKKLRQAYREKSGLSSLSNKEMERLERDLPESKSQSDALRIINQLKENTKKLREENLSLRKVLLGKVSLESAQMQALLHGDHESVSSHSSTIRRELLTGYGASNKTGSSKVLDHEGSDRGSEHTPRNLKKSDVDEPVNDTVKISLINRSSNQSSSRGSHQSSGRN